MSLPVATGSVPKGNERFSFVEGRSKGKKFRVHSWSFKGLTSSFGEFRANEIDRIWINGYSDTYLCPQPRFGKISFSDKWLLLCRYPVCDLEVGLNPQERVRRRWKKEINKGLAAFYRKMRPASSDAELLSLSGSTGGTISDSGFQCVEESELSGAPSAGLLSQPQVDCPTQAAMKRDISRKFTAYAPPVMYQMVTHVALKGDEFGHLCLQLLKEGGKHQEQIAAILDTHAFVKHNITCVDWIQIADAAPRKSLSTFAALYKRHMQAIAETIGITYDALLVDYKLVKTLENRIEMTSYQHKKRVSEDVKTLVSKEKEKAKAKEKETLPMVDCDKCGYEKCGCCRKVGGKIPPHWKKIQHQGPCPLDEINPDGTLKGAKVDDTARTKRLEAFEAFRSSWGFGAQAKRDPNLV